MYLIKKVLKLMYRINNPIVMSYNADGTLWQLTTTNYCTFPITRI